MVVPAGDGEGCYSVPDWPQHPAVMRNVMIYFRNNPSVTYYEGCNSPLTAAQLGDMKAARDMWDPHGQRYVGARDSNQSVPYEYGSAMDGTARSTTWPMWSAEYSREESPRRVWDAYTPTWDPHTMAYVTGGYVKVASPTYGGVLETTNGNGIANYPLCDFRQNSMESKTLCNIFKFWQGYAYSNFVEPVGTRTGSGVQIGEARIIFADSKTDGRMKDTEVSRVGGALDGARLPKEDYYALRVGASTVPDITILGHWNYPAGTTKTMYVIASCGRTGQDPTKQAAFPSAVTLGTYGMGGTTLIKSYTGAIDMAMGTPNQFVWTFPNVAFQPGVVKATATCGATMVTDQKVTTGAVVGLKLTPVYGPQGWFADGADIVMVDVEAVDAAGERVPTDEANVTFTHSGAGQWIGGYNSGVRQSLFKDNLWTEGGINRLFVRSTTTPGTFTITATRGTMSAMVTLTSTAFPIDANGLTQATSQRYDVSLGTEPTPIADPN
jgi:beta-galactosidase